MSVSKRSFRYAVLLLSVVVLASTSGCSSLLQMQRDVTLPSAGSKPPFVPNYTSVEDITVSSEPLNWDEKPFTDFTDKVTELMTAKNFEALDQLASEYRNSKERFSIGGGWKIHSFYRVVSHPTKPTFPESIGLIQEWNNATGSTASRVALSIMYTSWAWEARGTGYYHEVDPKNRAIAEERLNMALQVLDSADSSADPCYGYFEQRLVLGKATGMPAEQFQELFAEALRFDPTYYYFYELTATRLMPRWGGQPGQLVSFAEGLFDQMDETQALMFYYLIVDSIATIKHDDFFAETGLSWRKTKKGFDLFEKTHGITRLRVNRFASLALKAKDTQATCNTHKRLLGVNDFEPSAWKSREVFNEHTEFVLSQLCNSPKADNQAL